MNNARPLHQRADRRPQLAEGAIATEACLLFTRSRGAVRAQWLGAARLDAAAPATAPATAMRKGKDMRTQIMFGLVVLAASLLAVTAQAQQSTIRDASGRAIGTITTDSNGTKTFRDGTGRTTGTATTDSNGTTTFRDAGGRTTGTASRSRR
jgi:hypothetical protein